MVMMAAPISVRKGPTFFRRGPVSGLIVDNFAGGGGASEGLKRALGRDPDIAINHNIEAVKMHELNHPDTHHLCESVFTVDPLAVTGGRMVSVAWFSPDCSHFSRAKGSKPVKKKIRGLAWVVIRWAKAVMPKIIFLENVREFQDWGPLIPNRYKNGRLKYDKNGDVEMIPDPKRKGLTFKRWVSTLRNLGYRVEWKELNAADYGAPTTRKRLFLIARCDGNAIVWPEPTHGPIDKKTGQIMHGRQFAWRTAAECIDWTIPCKSIFDRKKPLAEKTQRRIFAGLKRYVIEAEKPFIAPFVMRYNTERSDGAANVAPLDEPVGTITGDNRFAVVSPTLIQTGYGERPGQAPRVPGLDKPLGTIVATGKHAVISAYIAGVGGRQAQTPPVGADKPLSTITAKNDKVVCTPVLVQVNHGGHDYRTQTIENPLNTITSEKSHAVAAAYMVQIDNKGSANGSYTKSAEAPLGTIISKQHDVVVAAHLTKFNQNGDGQPVTEPIKTVVAGATRFGLVSAFLAKHYSGVVGHGVEQPIGTVTARDHHSVVSAFMTKFYGTSKDGTKITNPCPTITADGQHLGIVTPFLSQFNGQSVGRGVDEPAPTMTAQNKIAEVRAFLIKYYNTGTAVPVDEPMDTITGRHRFGIVTIMGQDYQIVDIGMRMISPRELFNCQGFKRKYKLTGTKESQVARCGNSVPPVMAEVLARANVYQTVEAAA